MATTNETATDGGIVLGFLRREWPYLAMLVLALLGIGYTNLAPRPTADYWQVLVPLFAVICVAGQWRRARDEKGRWRLIWTQALHWGALLVAMRLMFLPQLQNMMNSDMIGLGILALLALGTFLAGVHAGAWQICVVGVVLALAVPAIATLEQAIFLVLLVVLAIAGVVAAFVWYRRRPDAPAD